MGGTPANGQKVLSTDYTAPHPLSVRMVNGWFGRHALELAGHAGIIKMGQDGGRGPAGVAGELGPQQQFRGAASLIGNPTVQHGLATGLPSAQPPGGRVPTIYDLLRDMDTRANAGLAMGVD